MWKKSHKKLAHITQSLAHSRCSQDILGRRRGREERKSEKRKFQSWLQLHSDLGVEDCGAPLGSEVLFSSGKHLNEFPFNFISLFFICKRGRLIGKL